MLLGKPKDKFEVYNDLDDELVNLFRCVRDRPAEFLLELGLLPLNSRTEFGEWLKFHTGRRDPVLFLPTQDVILDNLLPMQQWAEQMKKALHDRADYKEVLQAAAFFKRMRNSYASSGRSFACQPFSVRTTFRQLEETSDRLSNVIVENQSFETLIPHYDREDSFPNRDTGDSMSPRRFSTSGTTTPSSTRNRSTRTGSMTPMTECFPWIWASCKPQFNTSSLPLCFSQGLNFFLERMTT